MKPVKLPSGRRLSARARLVRSQKIGPEKIRIRRILVPIDFSPASRQAVDQAVAISRQFDAEIDLVNVYESTNAIAALANIPMVVSDSELERRMRRHLHDEARHCHLLLPNNHIHAVKGRPYEEICRLATKRGIDLIVIPTHGNTGLKHLLLGSTAERVVRHASCPVLVVRIGKSKRARTGEKTPWTASFRKIVVPIDFSACSLKGLSYAKRLARQFDARLVLLHCASPQYYFVSEEYRRYDLPAVMEEVERAGRQQLGELAEEIEREGIRVETDLEMGHAGERICGKAKECGADLIVTATHGHTGLKHVFLGSTAEYIMRHATSSVLVVPTRERPLLM
jgi:nucleotide-binding universal stress UspA family protein